MTVDEDAAEHVVVVVNEEHEHEHEHEQQQPTETETITNNSEKTDIVMLFLRANGMRKPSSKAADSFYQIENEVGDVVGKSIIVHNDLNPAWPPLKLDLAKLLCDRQNNRKQPISIAFYDYDEKHPTEPVELGRVTTNLTELHQASMEIKAQRGVVFFDRNASFEINQQPTTKDDMSQHHHHHAAAAAATNTFKVYIYDIVELVGTPTPFAASEIELLRNAIHEKMERLDNSESKIIKLREQIIAFEQALSEKEAYIVQELKRREEEAIEAKETKTNDQKQKAALLVNSIHTNTNEADAEENDRLVSSAQDEIEKLKSSIGEMIKLLSQAQNQNTILQLQIDAYKVESHDLRVLVDEIQQERTTQDAKLIKANQSEQALQEELQTFKIEMEQLQQAVDAKEQLVSASEAKQREYDEEVANYEEKLMQHKSLVITLLQEKSDAECQLEESKAMIIEKLDWAKSQVDQLKADLESTTGQLADSQSKQSQYEKDIAKYQDEYKEQTLALQATTVYKDQVEEDLLTAQSDATQLKTLVEEKNAVLTASVCTVTAYKEKVGRLESQIHEYGTLVETLQKEKWDVEVKLGDAQQSIAEKLETTKHQMEELRNTLSQKITLLTESESKNTNLTHQISSLEDQLKTQEETANNKLEQSKTMIQEQLNVLQYHMEELKSSVSEKAVLLSDSETRNATLNDTLQQFETSLNQKEAAIQKLQEEKVATEDKLAKATKLIQEKLEQTGHHMDRLRNQIADKNEQLKKAESDKSNLITKCGKLEETATAQEATIEQLQATNQAQATVLKNLVKAKTLLQGRFDAATQEIQILKYAQTENVEKLNESEYWITRFTDRIAGFETKVQEQDTTIEKMRTEKAETDENFKNLLWMKIQVDKLLADAKLDIERLAKDLKQKDTLLEQSKAENFQLRKENAALALDKSDHQALFEQQFNESLAKEATFQKQLEQSKKAVEDQLNSSTSELQHMIVTVAEKEILLQESKSYVAQCKEQIATFGTKIKDQEELVAKLESEKAILEEEKNKNGSDDHSKQELEEKDTVIAQVKNENAKLLEQMSKLTKEAQSRQALVKQLEDERKSHEAILQDANDAKKAVEEKLETIFKYPQLAYVFHDEEEFEASLRASCLSKLNVR